MVRKVLWHHALFVNGKKLSREDPWLLIPRHAGKFGNDIVVCGWIESRGMAEWPYYSFSDSRLF